jgi:hypothetical protein
MKTKTIAIISILAIVGISILTIFSDRAAAVPFGDCLAYDSFNRTNGSVGSTETAGPYGAVCPSLVWAWSNSNWLVSSNVAVNTPTLSNDQVVNGTFDSDTGWTKGTNWTIGSGTGNITPPGSTSNINQTGDTASVLGSWYYLTFDLSAFSAGSIQISPDSGVTKGAVCNSNNSYKFVIRSNFNGSGRTLLAASSAAQLSIDNVTKKLLTLNTLFNTVNVSTSNVVASVKINMTSGTVAGLVLNLDSSSSPNNFIVAYHDGTNLHLDKSVGGTYTSLINTSNTYVADAILQVTTTRSGDNLLVDVKYNGSTVGTQQTVADAGIINNTNIGLFSTYTANIFDNFYVTSNTANTPTSTQTFTPTRTFTPSNTFTPTDTFTPSTTATKTITNTYTFTWTFTPTWTLTPSNTSTPTSTDTTTHTPTNTATVTKTPTITNTPTETTIPETATYIAAYDYYSSIAQENYPNVVLFSVICGILILGGIIAFTIWFISRRKS